MSLIVKLSVVAMSLALTVSSAPAQNSDVKTYRVSGWQNNLVQGSPNLRNFYWEPMTHRVINTTRTTGKGANQIALPVVSADRARNRLAVSCALPSTPTVHVQETIKNSNHTYKRIADLQTSAPMTYPEVNSGTAAYSGTSPMRHSLTVRGQITRN